MKTHANGGGGDTESEISRGIVLNEQFEDIGSGMSSDRKKFDKICQMIFHGDIELLVIENKDRLVRFGFDMLEKFSNISERIFLF